MAGETEGPRRGARSSSQAAAASQPGQRQTPPQMSPARDWQPSAHPGRLWLPHAWDIKPASAEREELPEGSPKAPGRLPGPSGQLPTHLPLPQPSPGQAGGGERPPSTGQQRQAVTRRWRRAPSSAGEQPLGFPTQPGSHGGAPVCALGCACLSHCGSVDFRHCKAESTNLHLIKTALCNITYMSLHLTPIILRKAQALFQPVGLRACGADLPGT